MVKLTHLEYWHSFRPPHRNALLVNPAEVSTVRQLPFDERRTETACEIVMNDGRTYMVEGNADAVAVELGAE